MTLNRTTGRAVVGPVAKGLSRPVAILPIAAVIALVMPLLSSASALYVWSAAAIWVLFALGTNVLFGWSGMMSFGQAAFFGIGAYTVALLSGHGLSPLVLLLAGGAIAAVAGVAFAVVALRASGVEFAVLTLVFAQVLWLLTYHVKGLNGDDGFSGLSGASVLGLSLYSDVNFWYYVVAVVAVCALGLRRIELSSFGTAVRAVRDDALRAASLGLPVRRLQVAAYGLSAGVCGVAGGLIAQHQGVTTPQVLVFTVSGQVLVACLIGGVAFWGPAVGAVVLIVAENFMFGGSQAPALMTGLLLLVIVLVAPGGLTSLPEALSDLRRTRMRKQASRASASTVERPPRVPAVAGTGTEGDPR
ncbi:MAG: hypothetical protein JWQ07_5885 [Ramlibacter sp.]|jgi:branched-chain amino acid transport system permease protein|nr:hypothetical protein [Ramlibacter sp.]